MFLFNNSQLPKTKSGTVRDRPVRSIIKAITWRIIGTVDTIVLSYFVTGKVILAFSIGSIEVITKMVLYFLHERLWAIIRWGRMLVILRRNTRWTTRVVKRIILK
ncbi:MAG: DUF2061 domain-containing protein [Bacteroidia bacterium]|nr:DUF2061 domain-containing protein [Bacteroidia bacterium]